MVWAKVKHVIPGLNKVNSSAGEYFSASVRTGLFGYVCELQNAQNENS